MRKTLSAILLFLSSLAFAATAPSTSVTSTTVSGSTITVNATAHGLAANQGFCIAGSSVTSDNVCGVVAGASTNSFTFSSTTALACSSGCGTVTAAKQVIVLDVSPPPSQQAHILCWVTVPTPVSHAGAVSAWPGVSTAENAAIAAGYFVELSHFLPTPQGTTAAAFKTQAQQTCATDQAYMNSGITPGVLYGDWFDGTGWVQ